MSEGISPVGPHSSAPSSLVAALSELEAASTDEFADGATFVRSVERFVDELYRVPGGEQELRQRATFVEEQCTSGTRFAELLKSALARYVPLNKAIQKRRARQKERAFWKNLPNPERTRPKERAINGLALQADGGFILLGEISNLREELEFAKRAEAMNAESIHGIDDLLDEAIRIESEGAHIMADGCYYLFHAHRGRSPSSADGSGARALVSGWGRVEWPSILRAARQMVEWVNTASESRSHPTDAKSKIPAENRTRPMTFKEAARLMGKEGRIKYTVKWLGRCVKDGSVDCESITRQSHVFSKHSFPMSSWPDIVPDYTPGDGESRPN